VRLLVIVEPNPADQFFFSPAFLARSDGLPKVLAGHAVGRALSQVSGRHAALNANMDFGYRLHCPIEWDDGGRCRD
jgi:hypothetical protein